MIQLPLAATEPLHEIHLRLLQKVPGLQSRLWTRPQCRLRRQSLRPRARVRLGRMLKLQRNRPPDNLPVPHSTSPGRCWRSQTETSDKQWSGSLPFHRTRPWGCWHSSIVERVSHQVYRDYKATTDAEGNQTPIHVWAKTDVRDETVSFYGSDCTSHFFEWFEELAVDRDGDDWNVIIIFHNSKGYDGMFILHYCYVTNWEVTAQITVGTMILSLKSDESIFRLALSADLSRVSTHYLRDQQSVQGVLPTQIQHLRKLRV